MDDTILTPVTRPSAATSTSRSPSLRAMKPAAALRGNGGTSCTIGAGATNAAFAGGAGSSFTTASSPERDEAQRAITPDRLPVREALRRLRIEPIEQRQRLFVRRLGVQSLCVGQRRVRRIGDAGG